MQPNLESDEFFGSLTCFVQRLFVVPNSSYLPFPTWELQTLPSPTFSPSSRFSFFENWSSLFPDLYFHLPSVLLLVNSSSLFPFSLLSLTLGPPLKGWNTLFPCSLFVRTVGQRGYSGTVNNGKLCQGRYESRGKSFRRKRHLVAIGASFRERVSFSLAPVANLVAHKEYRGSTNGVPGLRLEYLWESLEQSPLLSFIWLKITYKRSFILSFNNWPLLKTVKNLIYLL